MRDEMLRFLGLMRRAGKLQPGEDATGRAARSGQARLILLASDASPNAVERAKGFAARAGVLLVRLTATKAELQDALGTGSIAMAAVCDGGFARALREKFPDDTERI